MLSGVRIVTPLLLALVLCVSAGCGGDGSSTGTTSTTTTTTSTATASTTTAGTGPTTIRITVEGGVPKGGIVRQTVHQGDEVVLVVTSDVADEIHLHGYDLMADVAAGGTARLPFNASIPGRFEVELENRSTQIADLTVEP